MAGDRRVPVFVDPSAMPEGIETAFPLAKLAELVRHWERTRAHQVEFRTSRPATVADVEAVHDPAHVRAVLAGEVSNGISGRDGATAALALHGVGSFMAAVRLAATERRHACAIGGGFHHAGPSRSHAFCTFNGLMAAAVSLLSDRTVRKVAIVDVDAHFGDGTAAILERHPMAGAVSHYSYAHEMLDADEVDGWLERLPCILSEHLDGAGVALLNAGVDPHVGDRMVRGVMTTEQVARREDVVFGTCRALGVPVAWVQAGGYQRRVEDAVALHDLAMSAAIRHA